MPTVAELQNTIRKHKDKNCPPTSKLKKTQLLALAKKFGYVEEVKAPVKKAPAKKAPVKKAPVKKAPAKPKPVDTSWKKQVFKFHNIEFNRVWGGFKEFYDVTITRTFPPSAIEKKALMDGTSNQELYAPRYSSAHRGKLSEVLVEEFIGKIRESYRPILQDILAVNRRMKDHNAPAKPEYYKSMFIRR